MNSFIIKLCMFHLTLVFLLFIGARCQGDTGTYVNPQLEQVQTSCGSGATLVNLDRYGRLCGDLFVNWYYQTIEPYYYYYRWQLRAGRDILQYENTTQLWNSICRWGDSMRICLRNILPQCDDTIGTELLNNPAAVQFLGSNRQGDDEISREGYNGDSLTAFYRRSCQGMTVKPSIITLIEDSAFDKNVTCLNVTHREDLRRCTAPLYEELNEAPRSFDISYGFWRQSIDRMAAGSLSCMYSIINTSPCNSATKKVMHQVVRLQLPSSISISDLNVTESTTNDFRSVLRCTVGVYGDPHLRLCWQPRLVTCSAPGEQVYISNDFFDVRAVNVAIGRISSRIIGRRATSVRSIKITFKSISGSSIVGSYSGENGNLPVVFDNTNSSTIGQGDDKVTLIQDRYNRRLLIQHSTGMIVALRQWSGNYFFTLRAAESLIQSSFGLLSTGCPSSETIGLGRFVGGERPQTRRRREVTVEQCEMVCNETTDLPEYRESCLFDCYVTEDVAFAVNMTNEASEDVIEIITRDEEIRSDALSTTTLAPTTKKPSSSTRQSFPGHLFTFIILMLAAILAASHC